MLEIVASQAKGWMKMNSTGRKMVETAGMVGIANDGELQSTECKRE